MKDIQISAAEKAIRLLSASGAQYKVILADGREYGDLVVVSPKLRTRVPRVAVGDLLRLYKHRVDSTKVGEVLQIPLEELAGVPNAHKENLRSAASSYASKTWGNGSYTTGFTDTHLEMLRIC